METLGRWTDKARPPVGHDRETGYGLLAERAGPAGERCLPMPRLVGVLVALAALSFLLASISSAAGQPCRPPLVDRQRFGFAATQANWQQRFDFVQLRAGWYVDHYPGGTAPQGMDRVLLIKLRDTRTGDIISPGEFGPLVDSNPGALWLISNEPDRCRANQDCILPEEYARLYHDLYLVIKSRDQTSQVAAGGIVQPTPLRLEYLNRILSAYQVLYGQPMPVDLWHIHNAILNEQRGSWGADIPPGIDADEGVIRGINDNDNMTHFRDQIWAFRQWMADHGYAGYPLVVSEYGVLMPDDYGFTVDRVNAFMSATFDFFRNTTDLALGDPTDGYRLVQRWAWYSLDDFPWNPVTGAGFNGNLFDPAAGAITPFGQRYASHTGSFPPLTYVDLGVGAFSVPLASTLLGPGQTITQTVQVKIVNGGVSDSGGFAVKLAYGGPASGTLYQSIANLPPASSRWLAFELSDLESGKYSISVEIDPDQQVVESLECNNQATTTMVVPTDRFYLPLLTKRSANAAIGANSKGTGSEVAPAQGAWPSEVVPGFQEFPMPAANSYPGQIALDLHNQVLWVSERDGNKIARFDLAKREWDGEYTIPTANSRPWGLALDASGNVWFAETSAAANQIGKLEVKTGDFDEFPLPSPSGEPWNVAIGDDGTVWFTERAGNKIAKLVPATRTITEYPVPTDDSQPSGIVSIGSNVWFTEAAANKLGWLDAETGDMWEFEAKPRPEPPFVEPLRRPQAIVATSAGHVWFTEMEGDKITLFYAATVQEFNQVPVRTANSEPYGIAMEGDVAVWFTERTGNKLGRYTGSPLPIEYDLPTPNSLPTDITIDSDGCAWYAAPGSNRIGRFCRSQGHLLYLPVIIRN